MDVVWVVPNLWRSEFISILINYFKAKQLNKALFINLFNDVSAIVKPRVINALIDFIFEYIQSSSCSSYDCELIALAKHIRANLLTWDKKVLSASPVIAIMPKDFIA